MNGTITEVFRQVQSGVEVKLRADVQNSGINYDITMATDRSELIMNRVILIGIRGESQVIQIMDVYLCMLFAENVITMEERNNFIEGAKHAMACFTPFNE